MCAHVYMRISFNIWVGIQTHSRVSMSTHVVCSAGLCHEDPPLQPFWTKTMAAINDNDPVSAYWWAYWVGGEELCLASPVAPHGASVWHLIAARMLKESRDRTRLLGVLMEKAPLLFVFLRLLFFITISPLLPPRFFLASATNPSTNAIGQLLLHYYSSR